MRPVRSLTLLSLILVLFAAGCGGFGTKLQFGQGELFHTSNVTREEAEKLGQALEREGFFTAARRSSVQVDRADGVVLIRFVIKEEYRAHPGYCRLMEAVGAKLREAVFPGQAVAVHVCDERLKTVKTLSPLSLITANGGTLYYQGQMGKNEAEKFAEFLVKEKVFAGQPAELFLDRPGDTVEIRIILLGGLPPGAEAEFRAFRSRATVEVFPDRPVHLHVCDELLNTLMLLQ